ncbi:hypothetical protein [Actinocorallia aurea]
MKYTVTDLPSRRARTARRLAVRLLGLAALAAVDTVLLVLRFPPIDPADVDALVRHLRGQHEPDEAGALHGTVVPRP